MKKVLFFAAAIVCLFSWLRFSNPAGSDAEGAPATVLFATIAQILENPDLAETFILTKGTVEASFSTHKAGFCILKSGGRKILLLSRGFTPPAGKAVACRIIPRRILGIGDKYITLAALAEFEELANLPEDFFEKYKDQAARAPVHPGL